jgi:hypothetical protein
VKTINTGIATIMNGISSENNYKTEIDFCKFDVLNLNMLKLENEKETTNLSENDQSFKDFTVLFIIHSKIYLNIYYINEDLEVKCIFFNKFTFHMNSVDAFYLPSNKTYFKELPIVAMISNYTNIKENSNLIQKNDCYLKFYSLKSKRIVHKLRFKKKIIQFISKYNFFAVSFADGMIKIFENDKMDCINTINSMINPMNSSAQIKINNNSSAKFNSNKGIGEVYYTSPPIFDITENYILYYNNGNYLSGNTEDNSNVNNSRGLSNNPLGTKKIKIKNESSNNNIKTSLSPYKNMPSLETMANEAYKSIYTF